jgi:hypothetical protein
MRIRTLILTMLCAITLHSQDAVTMDMLRPLFGKQWTGTLTYLDYSSGEETSIPVSMTVEPKNDRAIEFAILYPGEASANNTSTVKFSKDGKTFNGQKVEAVESLGDGMTEIVTTEKGKDNGRAATMTHTYVIGPRIYSSEKFVLYEGDDKAFLRNSYSMRATDQ